MENVLALPQCHLPVLQVSTCPPPNLEILALKVMTLAAAELAMDPELPPIHNPHHGLTTSSLLRERSRGSSPADNSSEPPLFSSDGPSASTDNYTNRAVKRLHRGTWWSGVPQNHATCSRDKPTKRPFERNFDSGVWMGSDDAEGGSDTPDEPALDSNGEPSLLPSQYMLPASFGRDQLQPSHPMIALGTEVAPNLQGPYSRQLEAISRVQRYLDEGLASVDLAGLNLGEIFWSTLSPLRYLTLHVDGQFPPSQEAYQALTPDIRLYLANNELSSLPSELYSLHTITTLSLRQNKFESLSPAIANLVELENLNLGGNSFRFLPWEILQLLTKRLTAEHLQVHPNPLARPVPRPRHFRDVLLAEPDNPRCLATTGIAYLDNRGYPCAGSCPAPSQHSGDYIPAETASSAEASQRPQETEQNPSHVLSLLELALRTCAQDPQLDQMLPYLSVHYPPPVYEFLKRTVEHKVAGGVRCSVCDKEYVIPRTEWVEWHSGISGPWLRPLPFLRRGCSWQCVVDFEELPPEWKDCGWTSS